MMEEIEFIFQVSELDAEALLPQVSAALKRRLELRQEALPRFLKRAAKNQNKKEDRYDKAAGEFLEGHIDSLKEQDVQICFSGEEMITVMGDLEDLEQDAVTFDQIELVMELQDIFFVIYQGRGVVLQKKDLDQELGTLDEFRAFVNRNIVKIIDLTEG